MTRPLADYAPVIDDSHDKAEENWLTRTTARAFAAAVSALLIATLVVNRSSEGLVTDGSVARTALASGTISLNDDDSGRALFDLSNMAPGRPIVQCLEVEYAGSIVPVDMILLVESAGDLGPYLNLSIDEGSGGGFEACETFVQSVRLYDGTLSDIASGDPLRVGVILNSDERRSYRITFGLQDEQEALGRAATADFIWEVTPS
jgi:hypothetical protein